MDVCLVLSSAEDEAADVAAPIATGSFSHLQAFLAANQFLDLPDVRLDARLLLRATHFRRRLSGALRFVIVDSLLQEERPTDLRLARCGIRCRMPSVPATMTSVASPINKPCSTIPVRVSSLAANSAGCEIGPKAQSRIRLP